MRLSLAVLLAAAAGALAAVILGEYDLRGVTPLVAGIMLAIVIGELAVVAAGCRSRALGISCALVVSAGMVWALRISSGNDWSFVSASGWVGAGLGALTSFAWAAPRQGFRGSGPPEDDSPVVP
ncbi:MAG TPA: hypothetical protein VM142_11590 [Acidimicrobiales bacterium]|nr:hypothetical protein [Acidimicrobiales bacterium]